MLEFLLNPELLLALGVFLAQFAGIIWKISKAQSDINDKIQHVEHAAEFKIQDIAKRLVEIKLEISNEYIKKDTFRNVMLNIDTRLIRLEDKLDNVLRMKA